MKREAFSWFKPVVSPVVSNQPGELDTFLAVFFYPVGKQIQEAIQLIASAKEWYDSKVLPETADWLSYSRTRIQAHPRYS